MFCINCGSKLPDAAKFCGSCGTKKVIPPARDTHNSEAATPKPAPPPKDTAPKPEAVKTEPQKETPPQPVKAETGASVETENVAVAPLSDAIAEPRLKLRAFRYWVMAIGIVSVLFGVISAILSADILLSLVSMGALVLAGTIGILPLLPWSRDYLKRILTWKGLAVRIFLSVLCGILILFSIAGFITSVDDRPDLLGVLGFSAAVFLPAIVTSVIAFFLSRKFVESQIIPSNLPREFSFKSYKGFKILGVVTVLGGVLAGVFLTHLDKLPQRMSKVAEAKDNPQKQFELATGYEYGDQYFSQSDKKYQEYIELAAAANHGEALYELAKDYISGSNGYEENSALYRENLKKAAYHGNYDAQRQLADDYWYGNHGFSQDRDRADFWQKKARSNKPYN